MVTFQTSTARIRLNVYIIDQYDSQGSTKTSTISDEVILTNGNTTSWKFHLLPIFDNLQSGTYTVEIRARMTTGASNNFMIDPGNYGQRMVIKETF